MYTKIKPPKYRIGRYTLNEYELRCLMSEVAEHLKPDGIKVKDQYGVVATILPTGRLDKNLYGLDINSNYTIKIIRLNNKG